MTVMTRDDDVEVARQRRSWPAQYKLDILAEIDAAKASGVSGAVGEISRRENLYSSLISEWRNQRDAGALEALKGSKVGRPPKDRTRAELVETRRRVEALEAELATARELIEAQGKVALVLHPWVASGSCSAGEGWAGSAEVEHGECDGGVG